MVCILPASFQLLSTSQQASEDAVYLLSQQFLSTFQRAIQKDEKFLTPNLDYQTHSMQILITSESGNNTKCQLWQAELSSRSSNTCMTSLYNDKVLHNKQVLPKHSLHAIMKTLAEQFSFGRKKKY